MPTEKITFRPGINREATATLNEGGWSNGSRVRFREGLPQPIGGWVRTLSSTFRGACRGLHAWVNLATTRLVALGTSQRLYVANGDVLNDITPIRVTRTLTNPYTTTAGSASVAVAATAHGAAVGDYVSVSAASTGGLVLSGEYQVRSATGDAFTIVAASPATTSTSGGGGTVTVAFLLGSGLDDVPLGSGWGAGTWGAGTYGTDRAASILSGSIRLWTLDHWGEELVACPRGGGIYNWKPSTGYGTKAAIIPNAPTFCRGILTGMPERHLIAFGADVSGTQDPLLVRWSDVEDYTTWTATATNSAGSYRLVGGTEIMGWLAAPQEILVWTDAVLYAMRFEGLPFVYGFFQQGEACGLIAPQAATVLNGSAYWMGLRGFFRYSGQVLPIDCTVWDDIFRNLNITQKAKITAAPNSGFNEVTWFYPSAGSLENDRYVTLNIQSGVWTVGAMSRTAWVDAEVFGSPLGAGPDGQLYTHEFGADADGQPLNPFIESGFFDIGAGQDFSFVDQVIPDFGAQSGPVWLTLKAQAYPNGSTTSKGPFLMQPTTKLLSPRVRGRQIAVRLESNTTGSFWRLGAIRLRIAGDGRK